MKFNKKKLKFLLIPNEILDYDLKQLQKIKQSLEVFDIQSEIFDQEYSEKVLIPF